jgi:hypothetical protein
MKLLQSFLLPLSITVFLLSGCYKKFTARKLDGYWKVAEGTGKASYKLGGFSGSTTIAYDGEVEIIEGDGIQEVSFKTITYYFNSKEGTYRVVTESKEDLKEVVKSYLFDGTGYVFNTYFDKKIKRSTTETKSGKFMINKKSGEVEKNSIIFLYEKTKLTEQVDNYSYFETGTINEIQNLNTFYSMSNPASPKYSLLVSEFASTSKENETSSKPESYEVESFEKDRMTIKGVNSKESAQTSYDSEFYYSLIKK